MSNNQQASFSAERRVILVFAVSALVGIVLVGGALRYFLQRAALAQCRTNIEGRIGVLASQCDGEMTEAQKDLELLAKTPSFQQLPCVDQIDVSINGVPENVDVEKRRLLTELMNKAERFSVLYVLRPNADIYALEPFALQPKLTKHNLSDRPYYQEAVCTKAPVISDSFVGADGVLAVVILVPILADNGDIIGYLGGAFHLTRLSRLVSKNRVKPFDAGYIVDRKGQLIAHTDTTLLKKGGREHFIQHHPLLSCFLATTNRAVEAEQGPILFDECVDPVDGKPHLMALVPLSSGWGLGLMRDREAVLAEARPVIWGITSLTGLLLALIGGLGVAFAHGIGRRWDGAERALRASEERFRIAAESLTDMVYEWDLKDRIDWFGDIDGLMGYPAGEFPRTLAGWVTTIHPEDMKRVQAAIESHLESMTRYDITYRVMRKDGQWRWWSARGAALRDERGKPYKWVGALTDITERRRGEEAFKVSQERLLFATEGANLGVWNWDTVTGELNWSDRCKALFGIRSDETMSYARFREALHPDDRERTDAAVKDALDNHKDYDIDYRSLWPDGTIHWLAAKGRGYYDAMGKALRLEGVVLDISDRKRAEEELRRHRDNLEQLVRARTAELEAVNHELEAFSYSVSHDLKAPLRSVDGFVRILEQEYAPRLDDEGRRLLQVVRDSAQDMGRLVNDLLTFSRLSRKDLKITRMRMNDMVQDARRQVEADVSDRIIRWEIGDLPVAFGDEAMIREVLVNLLSNAVKFTRPRQEAVIAVEGRVEGDEVRCSVTDNGVGFDMAYKDKLFCVFQRLHTADEFEGTGIGLALVQRIVQRHGGKVWAQGKVGQGATFGFRLPGKGNMESGKTKTEERI